ncbi:(d)CMP kinase [Candidatus Parcubacteria bacterium]|nr:(d)CMP kinase [Candidatus Parcubacteria bacterium]
MMKLIVIDGPSGVGKGTLTKSLGERLGLDVIDSGLWYRALVYKHSKCSGMATWQEIARTLEVTDLQYPILRTEEIGNMVPKVSEIRSVREALNARLRSLHFFSRGALIDGRAGAWEYPEADIKFFLTAFPEVRAAQRFLQLLKAREGREEISYERVLSDILARDEKDTTREVFPLKKHPDAIEIDVSKLTERQALARMLHEISESTKVALSR